jgi:hypothetical protein
MTVCLFEVTLICSTVTTTVSIIIRNATLGMPTLGVYAECHILFPYADCHGATRRVDLAEVDLSGPEVMAMPGKTGGQP